MSENYAANFSFPPVLVLQRSLRCPEVLDFRAIYIYSSRHIVLNFLIPFHTRLRTEMEVIKTPSRPSFSLSTFFMLHEVALDF